MDIAGSKGNRRVQIHGNIGVNRIVTMNFLLYTTGNGSLCDFFHGKRCVIGTDKTDKIVK